MTKKSINKIIKNSMKKKLKIKLKKKTLKQKENEWIQMPNCERRRYNGFAGFCENKKETIWQW